MYKQKDYEIPIWNRCLLSIEEAALFYHIGEAKLRKLADNYSNADFLLMNGNRILIKRKQFEKFLDQSTVI